MMIQERRSLVGLRRFFLMYRIISFASVTIVTAVLS
jgi:hypothetical protein